MRAFIMSIILGFLVIPIRAIVEEEHLPPAHPAEQFRAYQPGTVVPRASDITTVINALTTRESLGHMLATRIIPINEAVNDLGDTLLIECIKARRWDLLPWLLTQGADPLVRNKAGETALSLASLIANPGERDMVLGDLNQRVEELRKADRIIKHQGGFLSTVRAALGSDHAYKAPLDIRSPEQVILGSPKKLESTQVALSTDIVNAILSCKRATGKAFLTEYRILTAKIDPLPALLDKLTINVGGDFVPLPEFLNASLDDLLKHAGLKRLTIRNSTYLIPIMAEKELIALIKRKGISRGKMEKMLSGNESTEGLRERLKAFESNLAALDDVIIEKTGESLGAILRKEAQAFSMRIEALGKPVDHTHDYKPEKAPKKTVRFSETHQETTFSKDEPPRAIRGPAQ